MLDIKFVRENLGAVEEAMKNRNCSFDSARFSQLDAERLAAITEEESLQAKRNALSKEIGQLMGQGKKDEADAIKEQVSQIKTQLDSATARRAAADAGLKEILMSTPNMPHPTTPIGKDENDNPEVRRWGTPRQFDFEAILVRNWESWISSAA